MIDVVEKAILVKSIPVESAMCFDDGSFLQRDPNDRLVASLTGSLESIPELSTLCIDIGTLSNKDLCRSQVLPDGQMG